MCYGYGYCTDVTLELEIWGCVGLVNGTEVEDLQIIVYIIHGIWLGNEEVLTLCH